MNQCDDSIEAHKKYDKCMQDQQLKTWMEEENVFNKSLYDELISNNINTTHKLHSLSPEKLAKILHAVRMDVISQSQNEIYQNNINKLLVQFETICKTKLNTKGIYYIICT